MYTLTQRMGMVWMYPANKDSMSHFTKYTLSVVLLILQYYCILKHLLHLCWFYHVTQCACASVNLSLSSLLFCASFLACFSIGTPQFIFVLLLLHLFKSFEIFFLCIVGLIYKYHKQWMIFISDILPITHWDFECGIDEFFHL